VNRTEHLLTVATEECIEIALEASLLAQRLTKALRFGLDEVQPSQPESNRTRIIHTYEKLLQEGNDLRAALALLQIVPAFDDCERVGVDNDAVLAKQEKVARYLEHSARCGTLVDTEDVVKQLRMMAIIAGQSSVEGEQGERSTLEDAFAQRCTAWADQLEGKQA
jgi:hypothetical protein